jgi:hypothetical protein
MVGDSSGSSGHSHSSSSRYDDLAARRFKAERDETRRELETVSKKGRNRRARVGALAQAAAVGH